MEEHTFQPKCIGPYRLEKRLGAGGMGEVYLAWDERLRRRVAIKRIRHDIEQTAQRRARFRREARAAAGLSHPAIVQIHDILDDESGDAIVMEYIEGRSLAEAAAEGDLDGETTLALVRQVAEGLARAHERGVLHRDLKTENVMITPQGEAKILDFGLAKPLLPGNPTLTAEGALFGTVRAMSPEQAAGEPVDVSSDLFSLGVLLYELFTGRSPFQAANALATIQRIQTVQPPPPRALRPELPTELSSLIDRLLEKDPRRRLSNATDVADELRGIADLPGMRGLGPVSSSSAEDSLPTPSDAPTAARSFPFPIPVFSAGESESRAANSKRGVWPFIVVALLALAMAIAAGLLTLESNSRRVVVLRSQVMGNTTGHAAEAVTFGVQEAAIRTLHNLEGLEPLDATEAGPATNSPVEAARAAAADEVLVSTVDFHDGGYRISLSRMSGDEGRALWVSPPLEVSGGPRDSSAWIDAVSREVRRAYSHYSPRPGTETLRAEDADTVAYFDLLHRSRNSHALGEPGLAQLEAILVSSPRFLDAHLLAADLARTLKHLDRALEILDLASELDTRDPRILVLRFRVELDALRLEDAAATLEEIQRAIPGDIRVLTAKAGLAESRGALREAVDIWRQVVKKRPSWTYLQQLTRVEILIGDVTAARENLKRLLEIYPSNPSVLKELGILELQYGDLRAAEDLFLELSLIDPRRRSHHTNLGIALFIRGRYEAAAGSFRRALELAPKHRIVRINLADAELAAGHEAAALDLYRTLRDELNSFVLDQLGANDRMNLALCRIRLGDARGAVALAQSTLKKNPENNDVTFLAALVYSLAGERNSALASAMEAIHQGLRPEWFTIPGFELLHSDPEFRHLLSSDAAWGRGANQEGQENLE